MTGNECVIVKNGTRICGTGAALATADVVQDKSYFEIKIQSEGLYNFFIIILAFQQKNLCL